MVELVTPWSVEPVAFPFPQGEGSVPNLVEELDAAPLVAGDAMTPVAVSVVRSTPKPTTRMPLNLLMAKPPGLWRQDPRGCCLQELQNR